jgi:hypothetical protein
MGSQPMKKTLPLLAALLLCASARAATVTGMVQQITLNWSTNTRVGFSNMSAPFVLGPSLITSTPKPAYTRANGWFSNELAVGWYRVWIGDLSRDTVTVYIPDTNAVLNLWDQRTNSSVPAPTNLVFELVARKGATNGYAPLDSSAKVPTNYLYMNLLGGSGGSATSAIADVLTNNVTALANARSIEFTNVPGWISFNVRAVGTKAIVSAVPSSSLTDDDTGEGITDDDL